MSESDRFIKPYPSFPLTPHRSGKWVKKIHGKHYYFGRLEEPDLALAEYNAVKQAIEAGRQPTVLSDSVVSVGDLFNAYLDRQLSRTDEGRMKISSYADLKNSLVEFAKAVGKSRLAKDLKASDFSAAAKFRPRGAAVHKRFVTHVKAAFNWGIRQGKIPGQVPYGDDFAPKSKREARIERRASGQTERYFTVAECAAFINAADPVLKPMILLGLNGGFYSSDISEIPIKAIDIEDAWIEYPRPKTEVMRAVPLWPDTVAALSFYLENRPNPLPPYEHLAFINRNGTPYQKEKAKRKNNTIVSVIKIDGIASRFGRLMKKLNIERRGRGFGTLRHTFATFANEVNDKHAVNLVRGHAFEGMDEFYVKAIVRERMEKVVNHVRDKVLKSKVINALPGGSKSSRSKTNRRA